MFYRESGAGFPRFLVPWSAAPTVWPAWTPPAKWTGKDVYKRQAYRGVQMEEFDLEEALRVKPQLILVDELAHTNVPLSLIHI